MSINKDIRQKARMVLLFFLAIGFVSQCGLNRVHAKTISTVVVVSVNKVNFILEYNYVDQNGNTIASSETEGPFSLAQVPNKLHPLIIKEIPGSTYTGYQYKSVLSGRQSEFLTGDTIDLTLSEDKYGDWDDGLCTYRIDMVYAVEAEKVAVTFDKNAANATGTMEAQGVDKDSEVNLNANQFVNPGYVFLGWSTSPDGGLDELPEYQDQGLITVGEDITLYAIWGTPDMYLALHADRTTMQIGEETGFTTIVTNRDSARSTTLYNAKVEISFNRYLNYVERSSVRVYKNGLPINVEESFDPYTQKLVIPLGTMEKGETCTINFIGEAKISTSQTLIKAGLDGDVTPTTRSNATKSNNSIHKDAVSQVIRIR